jgi:hypothetical protein
MDLKSVLHCEALASMGRLFLFVDHGYGIALDRNLALTVCVKQRLVSSQAKVSGLLSRLQLC